MTTPTVEEIKSWPVTVPAVQGARAFGIGETKARELLRANDFPVRVLRIGSRYRVATADILTYLGLDATASAA
ncbi:DNA-binding protein [Lentzea chajnantorensis]